MYTLFARPFFRTNRPSTLPTIDQAKTVRVMRFLSIIVALLMAGCAYQQAAAPPKTRTVISYQCRPEPPKGCKSIASKSECDANRRCQWVSESDRARVLPSDLLWD